MIHFLWWFWLDQFWLFACPVQMVIIFNPAWNRRMQKGAIRRYLYRHFGLMAPAIMIMSLMTILCSASVAFLIAGNETLSHFFLSVYWTIILSWTIIDVITGGDKPKRWRKKAAELVKKLRISPPPRPVIQPF